MRGVLLLSPEGPIRLADGQARPALAASSDRLAAAIISAWEATGGPAGLLGRLVDDPPFVVSGLWPVRAGQWFMPRPICAPPPEAGARLLAAWDLPDLVPAPLFRRIAAGEAVQPAALLAALAAGRSLARRVTRGRAARDNATSRTSGRPVEARIFHADVDLWALVEVRDDTVERPLSTALRWLAEEGIGGGRSAGLGRVALKAGPLCGGTLHPLPEALDFLAQDTATTPARFVTLAAMRPRGGDPDLVPSGAESRLVRVEPRPPARSVDLFAEGSTFPAMFPGDAVDLAPDRAPRMAHPLWAAVPLS